MTRSRAPLLELTLFVSDLDRSIAFFSSLGLNVEAWPGAEDTTADVTLSSPDAPIIQLFKANDTTPPDAVRPRIPGHRRGDGGRSPGP